MGIGAVGVASAFFVVLGAFLNLFQSGLQIIGVGTAISLVLTTTKLIYDRREDRRRKTLSGIQRLQPSIYNPILSWAVVAKRTLENEPDGEFAYSIGSPPDLSTNGDYVAIVGDQLRSSLTKTTEAARILSIRAAATREEHAKRLENMVKALHPDWKSTWLYLGVSEWDLRGLVYQQSLRMISDMAKTASEIQMSETRKYDGGKLEACAKEFVDALVNLTGLASYKPLAEAKAQARAEIENTLRLAKEAIEKGEPDWRLK